MKINADFMFDYSSIKKINDNTYIFMLKFVPALGVDLNMVKNQLDEASENKDQIENLSLPKNLEFKIGTIKSLNSNISNGYLYAWFISIYDPTL